MCDVYEYKRAIIEKIEEYNQRYELSKNNAPNIFDPGWMDNLNQYAGRINKSGHFLVRVDVCGLDSLERSMRLQRCSVKDELEIKKSEDGRLIVVLSDGFVIGWLPHDLCEIILPLYDSGYLVIERAFISYLERLSERSKYAERGIMFVQINARFRGIK